MTLRNCEFYQVFMDISIKTFGQVKTFLTETAEIFRRERGENNAISSTLYLRLWT